MSSQNADKIAFTIDLALLARALRSGSSTDSDRVLMKLVKKSPSPNERALPFLSVESKVSGSSLILRRFLPLYRVQGKWQQLDSETLSASVLSPR